MSPSDLDLYSYREFNNKLNGWQEGVTEEWRRTRLLCYYGSAGYHEKGIKSPSDLFDLPGDAKEKKMLKIAKVERVGQVKKS